VADYKKYYNSKLPLVAVLTDYIPHSYWIYDEVDFYISPSEDVSARLQKKGVPAAKIKSYGIPFDPKFHDQIDRNTVCQKLGLNPQIPTVLIMGGGQGLGPIKTIIKNLEKVKNDSQEIIVCGTNKKLYKSLKRKIKKYKKEIRLFGYVNNINELMSASDIIITKPGGVTTAELLTRKLALIIAKPLPGQEANNTAYLSEKGAAIKVDRPDTINAVIEELLTNKNRLNQLKEAAAKIAKPNASLDIARLLLSL